LNGGAEEEEEEGGDIGDRPGRPEERRVREESRRRFWRSCRAEGAR
jgi:hypothetical protein